MNGFINLFKPQGMSSAYAVGMVKKKFNMPCGHMGTLDPLAEGVLPIAVGQATRLFQYTLEKEKVYIAEFTFGLTTDTLDRAGEVISTCEKVPTKSEIEKVLQEFVGEIDQVPPKYSAKNIDGKRGYQLARKGVEFALPPKKVVIKEFSLIEKTSENSYTFKIECEGGTYIRSLARDLGLRLDSLAYMSKLTRQKSGIFCAENSVGFDELKQSENPQKYLVESDSVISYPKLKLSKAQAQKILDGVFEDIGVASGIYRVYCEDAFWGVGVAENGVLRIKSYVR